MVVWFNEKRENIINYIFCVMNYILDDDFG